MGIASIVVSIASLLLMIAAVPASMVPVLGPILFALAPATAIAGITLAGIGLSRGRRYGEGGTLSTVGLVLNILFLIPALLMAMTCGLCSGCYSAAALSGDQRSRSSNGPDWAAPPGAGPVVGRPTPAAPTPSTLNGPRTSPCLELPQALWTTTGDLSVSGYRWQRPGLDGCPAVEVADASYPYALHVFCNSGPARAVDLQLSGEGPQAVDDPVLIVYDGASLPDDPRQCRVTNGADSDGPPAGIDALPIPPGGQIVVVVTSFDPAQSAFGMGGRYRLTLTPHQ